MRILFPDDMSPGAADGGFRGPPLRIADSARDSVVFGWQINRDANAKWMVLTQAGGLSDRIAKEPEMCVCEKRIRCRCRSRWPEIVNDVDVEWFTA